MASLQGQMNEQPSLQSGDEDEGSDRRMDEELKILGQMLRTLSRLDEPARARVVAYLSSRFYVS